MLKDGETIEEYKRRVIDPISQSFCGAKWLNATIWLGHGRTASCHHPPMHQIDPSEIAKDPSLLHNTLVKKVARQQMLDGERPEECDYCWKIEDLDQVSDRSYKTLQFSEQALSHVATSLASTNVTPKTLEISFDRTCQFACAYCSPVFSSTWANEIKRFGAYEGLTTDDHSHFASVAEFAQPFKREDNPFIAAFWRWWPTLSIELEELRITGGEPLMSVDVWKLLDWFEANPSSTMRFGINTNLGAKDEIINKLIAKTKKMRHFEVYTSNEAHGRHAEYIRDGLDYEQWLRNVERLLSEGNIKQMNIMFTVNALCLDSMTALLDDLVILKRTYGNRRLLFSMNILRQPLFQSVAVMPEVMRYEKAEMLHQWCVEAHSDGMIEDFEINHIMRLVTYLKNPPDVSHRLASMESDFKRFYLEYDRRRGKSFSNTFSQKYQNWFSQLKL